jgi:hypothetical protein
VKPRGPRLGLGLLLIVSYGLRVWLANRGGQRFWADEDRYNSAGAAVEALRHGRWRAAAQELLGHADHLLFRWFGLAPAFFEDRMGLHPAVVAAYFGFFSVLAVFLIWAVARRAGADEAEAFWAAFLAACANSLFYYSRHFFPYDIALCAMLGALWLALGRESRGNSFLVGAAAAVGFLVYNGYWLIGGCVLILHTVLGDGGRRRAPARAAWSAAGLVLPLLALAGLGAAVGYNLIADDYQWGVMARGDFPFGYRVVSGYLWSAEGGLLVIWLAALSYALAGVLQRRRWGRLAWHAGGLVLALGGLLILSDVLPFFTVQGRRVRELVPFLCLSAAVGLGQFIQDRRRCRRAWAGGIALVAAGCAAWNFSGPLRQVFPAGFQRLAFAAAARQPGFHAYRLVHLQANLMGQRVDDAVPSYPVILRRPHPLQYRPYQYEGYDTAQRAELNRHDLSMRLLALPASFATDQARWRGYPGPVRLVLRFPPNASGHAESLVATGRTGRGDIFYLRYPDAGHVAFALDHWGVRATDSPPIAVDYSRPHELVLFAGFLLPPTPDAPGDRDGPLYRQRDRLVVWLDGTPVFSMVESFYPVSPESISFGVNFIGGSVEEPQFTGEILEFGSPPPLSLPPLPPG